MANDPFLIAVFFGFVPGMGFLYILLHRYNAFFAEKRIFRAFFIGLAMGFLLTLLENVLAPTPEKALGLRPTASVMLAVTVFAGLLALLEAVAFAAFLNWKTYRGKRDTPYYGVAFGVGFGATKTIVYVNFFTLAYPPTNDLFVDVSLVCLFGILLIGDILRAGTVGAWIGVGSATQRILPAIGRTAVAGTFFTLLLYGFFAFWPGLAFVSIAVGVIMVARSLLPLLDRVVPPEVLREMEIHNRRIARKVQRDDEAPRV